MSKLKIIPSFVPLSHEELSQKRRERTVLKLHAERAARPGTQLFSVVSLAAWLGQVKASGISFVPAEVACQIPVDTILGCEEPRPGDEVHWAGLVQARNTLGPADMMRWDCCATLDMKSMMQDGGETTQDAYLLQPHEGNPALPRWRAPDVFPDPRTFDILFDYPGDHLPVLKRPWVEARRDGSHPVEYRVFVRNSEILGIANYYMQRPMTMTPLVRLELKRALESTQHLVQHLHSQRALPFNLHADVGTNGFDPDKVSCTLDFLVDQKGEVRFLEAGPPFGMGAHPCSFIDSTQEVDRREVISVRGVCLAPGAAVLPLSDLA